MSVAGGFSTIDLEGNAERPNPDFCVLMSTYRGETAANLDACLNGVALQSLPADKVVLVIDGPIDDEQERVIERYASKGFAMTLVRLPVGGGLARALNAGLPFCDRDFVMRVDTDDVSRPDRFAVQLSYMRAHPEIDFVSSWVREVYGDGAPSQIKVSPTAHDNVVRALRWRNVIAHPAAVMRTSALRRVGGYRPDFGMLEDYDLFVRLALAGARFHIIPKVLVDCGASTAQKERRGGLTYLRNEWAFRRNLLKTGFVDRSEFVITILLYSIFRVLSGPFRRRLYGLVRS